MNVHGRDQFWDSFTIFNEIKPWYCLFPKNMLKFSNKCLKKQLLEFTSARKCYLIKSYIFTVNYEFLYSIKKSGLVL